MIGVKAAFVKKSAGAFFAGLRMKKQRFALFKAAVSNYNRRDVSCDSERLGGKV